MEFRAPPPDGFSIPGVDVISRDGNAWRLAVAGDVNAVVRELSRYDLEDLVFERLSLEELFLGIYQSEPERAQPEEVEPEQPVERS